MIITRAQKTEKNAQNYTLISITETLLILTNHAI